jgi:hypothetical protein
VLIGDGCDGFGESMRLSVNPCPLWDITSVVIFLLNWVW